MKAPAAILTSLWFLLLASVAVFSAQADPILVVFYEEGCSSCEEMDELLVGMTIDAPEGAIVRYEITEPGSMELLAALANTYNIDIPATVPIVFVADDVVVGMGRTQEFTLRNAIGDCLSVGCETPMARLPISQIRTDLPRLAVFIAVFLAIAWFQLH
jgi:thiol-disulfide isomerase/thioredoxin